VELVDEDVAEAALQVGPDLWVVADEIARAEQQSLAGYVTVTGATCEATAAGSRSRFTSELGSARR
jgi:hypothetical protein